jgi:hypothetical protein
VSSTELLSLKLQSALYMRCTTRKDNQGVPVVNPFVEETLDKMVG